MRVTERERDKPFFTKNHLDKTKRTPTSSDGDFLRNHPAAYHGEPGADGVTDHTTDDHTVYIFAGAQDDRGQLGPVAPLRQERHREGLHEDSEQKIPRAALLVLADDTRFGILHDGGRRFTFQLKGLSSVAMREQNIAIRMDIWF